MARDLGNRARWPARPHNTRAVRLARAALHRRWRQRGIRDARLGRRRRTSEWISALPDLVASDLVVARAESRTRGRDRHRNCRQHPGARPSPGVSSLGSTRNDRIDRCSDLCGRADRPALPYRGRGVRAQQSERRAGPVACSRKRAIARREAGSRARPRGRTWPVESPNVRARCPRWHSGLGARHAREHPPGRCVYWSCGRRTRRRPLTLPVSDGHTEHDPVVARDRGSAGAREPFSASRLWPNGTVLAEWPAGSDLYQSRGDGDDSWSRMAVATARPRRYRSCGSDLAAVRTRIAVGLVDARHRDPPRRAGARESVQSGAGRHGTVRRAAFSHPAGASARSSGRRRHPARQRTRQAGDPQRVVALAGAWRRARAVSVRRARRALAATALGCPFAGSRARPSQRAALVATERRAHRTE